MATTNTSQTLNDLITRLHAAGVWNWTDADGQPQSPSLETVLSDFRGMVADGTRTEARLIELCTVRLAALGE